MGDDELQRRAEAGEAEAQGALGTVLLYGLRGRTKDEREGLRWLTQAAEAGDALAQQTLGHAYSRGRGVEKDPARAVHWWTKAAEQGQAPAFRELGFAYWKGRGVPADQVVAAQWFRRSADQGDDMGQFLLGGALLEGRGVPKDVAEGIRLWKLAAEQGEAQLQLLLGRVFASDVFGPRDLDEARKWLGRAAAQGNPLAESELRGLVTLRYPRLWKARSILVAAGAVPLVYQLVSRPFAVDVRGVAALWACVAIPGVLAVALAGVARLARGRTAPAQPDSETAAEKMEVPEGVASVHVATARAFKAMRPWDFLITVLEDGLVIGTLLWVGPSVVTAVIAAVFFGLLHYPNYRLRDCFLRVSLPWLAVTLWILPRFGFGSILVGHFTWDLLALAMVRAGRWLLRGGQHEQSATGL